jgi:ribonuclease-3 family protein
MPRIIDDETMYVDLQIPSNGGDYEVTAKSEFNDAKSTFEVNEYEVETGDYVLKDNRIVRQEYITELTDKEKEIVRRGRNTENHHVAKNANVADYAHATAFEALIGYLYLTKQDERLEEILNMCMKKTDMK